MSVKLIIDSTANVAENIKDRFTVVPLSIFFGEEEYIDGVTITHDVFYQKLIESDVMPSTSQATPGAFAESFAEATADGSDVVAITISQKLSGTYQSAVLAAEDYPGRVYVVDSQTVAIGAGILAEMALSLADDGMTAEAIAHRLTEERSRIRIIALLDTLEYLKRGGRISKTAALAGGILSIKPVIGLEDGEIRVLGKARGSKQGNNLLVQEIQKAGGVDFSKPLLLGYTGLSDLLLEKYKKDSAFLWKGNVEELHSAVIGSVVGTHAGPGAIAAAFFCKKASQNS